MAHLEDRKWQQHKMVLEFFCRTDKTVLCVQCSGHNTGRDVVLMMREYKVHEVRVELRHVVVWLTLPSLVSREGHFDW